MTELEQKIAELEERLNRLVRTQIGFQSEVSAIRNAISDLRNARPVDTTRQIEVPADTLGRIEVPPLPERPQPFPRAATRPLSEPFQTPPPVDHEPIPTAAVKTDLERFIGENLISKIGIVVLILGVGIGGKYAIDNGWISPLARLVFGYVMGLGLLGFAVKLKAKYLNFSAVLMSGAMAIFYFVTYFSHSVYSLIPQAPAFALMAIFTVGTVAAAIFYNRQIIAHIGLVGAYAVPFLLSSNSGNYLFLFVYMAIINGGILAIAVRKYWRGVFYTSSAFTWLIFGGWFVSRYSAADNFGLALTFLAVFFGIFYATKVVHGILRSEAPDWENVLSMLATGSIFFSFCLVIGVSQSTFQYGTFFTYLAAASLTILLTSYRFYGRVMVYLAYPFTWLIFGTWLALQYNATEHFALAITFAAVFFAIYYGATLIYRLVTDSIGMVENCALVFTNSFAFYGFGYNILSGWESFHGFEGLFTASHAAFHSIVALSVAKLKPAASDVLQVLVVLIITFTTITIPVQFNGNYITLIWSVEAAVLFSFGRIRGIRLFEYLAFPVTALAGIGLLVDWLRMYSERTMTVSDLNRLPVMNGEFVTGLVFVAALALIYFVHQNRKYPSVLSEGFSTAFGLIVASAAVFALYNVFRIEIDNYFHLLSAAVDSPYEHVVVEDLQYQNFVWQLSYSMLFAMVLSVIDLVKVRSLALGSVGAGTSVLFLLVFISGGMFSFSQLQGFFLRSGVDGYEAGSGAHVGVRYLSYLLAAGLLYVLYRQSRAPIPASSGHKEQLFLAFEAVLYTTLFITLSCELLLLMELLGIADSIKLGLSILWGIFALALIAIGIAKSRKHLRIGAIALLAVTLVKLFLYDIADLATVPKTILFVSLGLLMLIVSFLYNKYKVFIFGPTVETVDE